MPPARKVTYLDPASIYVKTVPFTQSVIGSAEELVTNDFLSVLFTESPKGYCEREVDNMLAVGNQALCGGGARDVGFYFATNFPVAEDGTTYAFKTPTDFGRGGISILDG